jgi:hypothetical protein
MRRYKRLLVSPDDRLPANWKAADSLRALVETNLADCMLAEDLDTKAMISAAIAVPEVAVAVAASRPRHRSASRNTVRDLLPAAMTAAIHEAASADWLDLLSREIPTLAGELLVSSFREEHAAWGEQFWRLEAEDRKTLIRAVTESETQQATLPLSLVWILVYSPDFSFAKGGLSSTSNLHGSADALNALVDELKHVDGERLHRWYGTLGDSDSVRAALALVPHLDRDASAVLLEILDPGSRLLREVALRPWRSLGDRPIRAVAAAHLFQLMPSDRPAKTDILVAGRAFAAVWGSVAREEGLTWESLGRSRPTQSHSTSERVASLSVSFASRLLSWEEKRSSASAVTLAVKAVRHDDRDAAAQLVAALETAQSAQQPRKGGGKESRTGRRKRGLLEQAWDAVLRSRG